MTTSNDSGSDVTPAGQDRVGNDYREGANPSPGGDVDTGASTLPPYEGRSKGSDFPESGGSEEPTGDSSTDEAGRVSPDPEQTPGGATASPAEEQPASDMPETEDTDPGVGPAHTPGTARGEDRLDKHGTESGRQHTGTDEQDGADRPAGESTARDQTGIDPQEGTTDRTAG